MKRILLASALTLVFAGNAFGHARFLAGGTLLPRNNIANKVGPCGSSRTNLPTFLIAGQQLTVQWDEFIEHPGYYRIAFSPADDLGFDQNIILNNIPDLPGATPANPRVYSRTITVPSTPCQRCTLQLIQYMTENPALPELYFSCADIVILPVGSTLPTPNPSPTPTGGLGSGSAGSSGSSAGSSSQPPGDCP
ncbi:MAG TPA: SCE4755 family polysaccharide monooxygenase-like protein [Bdellovibrionota bacterium]|nr:SCE4755 family polysaccharide monooxygenase-like protein [Bdellovibrionota bacterium]